MPFAFGSFNEFSDSVTKGDPIIEAIARSIKLGPFTGKFYEAMGAPSASISQKEFKVYSRSKTVRGGAIDANWDDDDTTGLGVADTALVGITVGHVLDIGGEVVIVKAVDRSNGTISVYKRGDGGTTAAAHTSGATFEVIGSANADEDLPNVEAVSETTSEWSNYVQTVFEKINWTKHGELKRKGLSDANATFVLLREAEIRVAEMLAKMAIRGVKAQATNSSNRYMSAGLLAQLADVSNRNAAVYNVNGLLTEAKFKAALKARFDAGASLDTIWCSPTAKEYLNHFIGSNSAVMLTDSVSNHTAGGIYATKYNYEGALLDIRVDADMPNDRIAVVNQGKCKKGWLEGDGLRQADEPSRSSRETVKSIQGSIGFLIEDVGTDHLLLYGISGTGDARVTAVDLNGSTVTTISGGTV